MWQREICKETYRQMEADIQLKGETEERQRKTKGKYIQTDNSDKR
jgi:hypothetical protein